jgi:flagellar basal body-associated protein FliL
MSTPNNPGEFPTYPTGPSYGGGMGQPPMGQPPMGQPPMYGQPGYGQPMMPPAAPRKKSRKGLWITLGVIAGVLVLACGGIGFVFFSAFQEALKPVNVATTFCNDLKGQKYTTAYDLLSSNAQGQISRDLFVQGAQLQDQIDGTVKSCGPVTGGSADAKIDVNAGKATLKATVQRNQAFTGNILLIKQGSDWKIDDIDSSLQGRDIAPIVVADTFCKVVVAGDYHTAYALLSTHLQGQESEDDLRQTFTAPDPATGATVTIQGCTPKFGAYTVSDTSATLPSSINASVGSTTVSVDVTLSFVKEGGTWKIDNLQFPQD